MFPPILFAPSESPIDFIWTSSPNCGYYFANMCNCLNIVFRAIGRSSDFWYKVLSSESLTPRWFWMGKVAFSSFSRVYGNSSSTRYLFWYSTSFSFLLTSATFRLSVSSFLSFSCSARYTKFCFCYSSLMVGGIFLNLVR